MTDVGSDLAEEVMLRKPTTITVTAERLDYAPWVYFWMEAEYSKGGGKKQGEYLKFDKKEGEFDLEFNLVDRSGLNLGFLERFEDAMWVQVGATCPPAGPGDGNGAIFNGSVPDPLTLKATNRNGKGELLTFNLRFSGNYKDKDNPPYEYDPRIINGGG